MRTQVMVLQTFVFNTILLTNFDFNRTLQDFFRSWHWSLKNFNDIRNYLQKFVL